MKRYFLPTAQEKANKRNRPADDNITNDDAAEDVTDIDNDAITDVTATDNDNYDVTNVNDTIELANVENRGPEVLRQSITIGNVVVTRDLEQGIASKSSRERKLQLLQNEGKNERHGWESTDIGSPAEMVARFKENNAEIPIQPHSKNPIPNDESLIITIVEGRRCLYCTVCKTHVNANKVACSAHLLSGMKPGDTRGHGVMMKAVKSVETAELRLAKALKSWMRKNDKVAGFQHVDYENHVFRMNCLYHFMLSGNSLRSIDKMKSWLEKGFNRKLVNSNKLTRYVPSICESEKECIEQLLDKCKYCSVIFDGTTRVDEILCLVLRFVTYDFRIYRKLVSLKRYDSCKNAEQLAQAVHDVVNNRYSIRSNQVVCFQRDRAAANEKMFKIYKAVYLYSYDLHCVPHTITHVGERIKYMEKLVDRVISLLQSMLNQNGGANKARFRWMTVFGVQ